MKVKSNDKVIQRALTTSAQASTDDSVHLYSEWSLAGQAERLSFGSNGNKSNLTETSVLVGILGGGAIAGAGAIVGAAFLPTILALVLPALFLIYQIQQVVALNQLHSARPQKLKEMYGSYSAVRGRELGYSSRYDTNKAGQDLNNKIYNLLASDLSHAIKRSVAEAAEDLWRVNGEYTKLTQTADGLRDTDYAAYEKIQQEVADKKSELAATMKTVSEIILKISDEQKQLAESADKGQKLLGTSASRKEKAAQAKAIQQRSDLQKLLATETTTSLGAEKLAATLQAARDLEELLKD